MKTLFLYGIQAYRYGLSPLLPPCCRFYPGCSKYAELALRRYGLWRALFLICCRLLRCHPWHPGGYDPVP